MNNAPQGWILILGDPYIGSQIGCRDGGISDADGIDYSSREYQWLRNGLPIDGATEKLYTVQPEDFGAEIKVIYAYTDLKGNVHSVESKPKRATTLVREANEGAVATLYQWGLTREPDDAGLAFWTDRLEDVLANEQPDRILAMRQLMLEFTEGDGYADEGAVAGR